MNGIVSTAARKRLSLREILPAESVFLGAAPKNREEALWGLSVLARRGGGVENARELFEALQERDALGPTGMGEGVAIPHARTSAVNRPLMAAMTAPGGVEYPSVDGRPVVLFFMIATPEDSGGMYMDLLAGLSSRLLSPGLVEGLLLSKSTSEFCGLL